MERVLPRRRPQVAAGPPRRLWAIPNIINIFLDTVCQEESEPAE